MTEVPNGPVDAGKVTGFRADAVKGFAIEQDDTEDEVSERGDEDAPVGDDFLKDMGIPSEADEAEATHAKEWGAAESLARDPEALNAAVQAVNRRGTLTPHRRAMLTPSLCEFLCLQARSYGA
ncbi:MAG: hypothetical protein AB7L90_19200 [Hyphomicrobiaceae bacterium]